MFLLLGKPWSGLVAHCGTLEEQVKNWIAPSQLCLGQIFEDGLVMLCVKQYCPNEMAVGKLSSQ